jgi:hypothetical protein
MNTLVIEFQQARAQSVQVSEDTLVVELIDSRVISVPLAWYPRLWYGNEEERSNFEIIGDGEYIHWPDLDEDLSINGILAGHHSMESAESLKSWLTGREEKKKRNE